MDDKIRHTIVAALQNQRGDNYERALHAFKHCTPEQMKQEYGASGQTRQQIVDSYREHVEAVDVALAWVKAQA